MRNPRRSSTSSWDVPLATPVRGVHGTTALQRSLLVLGHDRQHGVEGLGQTSIRLRATRSCRPSTSTMIVARARAGARGRRSLQPPSRSSRSWTVRWTDGYSRRKPTIEMALLDVKGRRARPAGPHRSSAARWTREVPLKRVDRDGASPRRPCGRRPAEWLLRRGFTTARSRSRAPDDEEHQSRVAAVRAGPSETALGAASWI